MNSVRRALYLFSFLIFLFVGGPFNKGGLCYGQYASREQEKNKDLMFLQLRAELQRTKRPEKLKDIKFAIAEYFYTLHSFYEAKKNFEECAQSSSTDIRTLLANIYLRKMAKVQGRDAEAEAIKKRLFSKKFILLFHDYKSVKYHSRLANTYRLEYFLDHIRVYKNGSLFAQIRP